MDITGYLRRLGVTDPGPPSVDALRALHAAQVERITYEAIDIQLGLVSSIDPYDSVARFAGQRRGGYCYHLNGAFSVLLRELGYDVTWHRAGVQGRAEAEPCGSTRANHLALTVSGLDGDWLVDTGLGDAMHEPLPLRAGEYAQGPLRFRLRPSETDPGGWRFDHDPAGSFAGMDFAPGPATLADFTDRHHYLSTSPESGFVRTCSVQRRDAAGVDSLTGCVLKRSPGGSQVLETAREWFEALADVFGVVLEDEQREPLWAQVHAAHEAWSAQRGVQQEQVT